MLEDGVMRTRERIQECEELLFGSSEENIIFGFLVSLIFHKQKKYNNPNITQRYLSLILCIFSKKGGVQITDKKQVEEKRCFIISFVFKFHIKNLFRLQMADKLSISFDQENNIRVLDPQRFRESDHLKSLSMEFITKVIAMDQNMSSLTECLDDFAIKIQKQKLRALGQRNKWESEAENRKRKMMELNNYLNEKKAELQRYTVQLQSLTKVQAQQKVLINKLSSNQ